MAAIIGFILTGSDRTARLCISHWRLITATFVAVATSNEREKSHFGIPSYDTSCCAFVQHVCLRQQKRMRNQSSCRTS